MKKFATIFMALLLALALVSCAEAAPSAVAITPTPAVTASPEPTAALPNPVVEVEGSAEFFDLGFIIAPHQQADSAVYSIIGGTLAQIVFTLDGETFTYRAAVTNDDISGVYETFGAPQPLDLEGPGFTVSVLIRTIGNGENGALAQWHYEDVEYSFYTPDKTDYEALTDVLLPIIYNDLPFAACCG
jgi:hypothetical protein